MALINCPECGREISDKAPACPHCGVPLTTTVAAPATPSVPQKNDNDELEKLLTLARQAKASSDNENAARYYEMVFMKDPANWEANFYQVYYKAMQCKIMNISSAATSVANCVTNAANLIYQSNMSDSDKKSAMAEMTAAACAIATMLAGAATNHYSNHSTVDGVFNQCATQVVSAHEIMLNLEAAYVRHTTDMIAPLTALRELIMIFVSSNYKFFNNSYADNLRARLSGEIRKQKPSYEAPEPQKGGGGCYVATCVYGSYNCPQVWTLRRFRDDTLAATWYGRAFIRCYYAVSPTLVQLFGETKWFRAMWKHPLDRMVSGLQRKGVENTPYNDRSW